MTEIDRQPPLGIKFDVYGVPGPMGSKRYVGRSKAGRGIMIESSAKVKPWREAVKWAAREAMVAAGIGTMDAPLRVRMVFTVRKPKSAPKRRRTWPDRMPDLSKLARSTDDARVVEYARLAKVFPGEDPDALDRPGVWIHVEPMQ